MPLTVDELPGFQISLLTDQPPQSVFDLNMMQLIGFLREYQSRSNPQQFANILGLLQSYQSSCPSLQYIQLIIPWSGTLATIDIKIDSKIGWSSQIQFPFMLALELVTYTRESPTAETTDIGIA